MTVTASMLDSRCLTITQAEMRRTLKRIGETNFSCSRNLDEFDIEMRLILLDLHRITRESAKTYRSFITDIQYLLMFPRRRRELSDLMFFGGQPDRVQIKKAIEILVCAAFVRHQTMAG